ncbi:MAG TPA: hypothetical protein VM555_09235, partial [Tahibacter sp.]|nr:hypothetical protein [Tahibacter sp.]
MSYFIAQNQNGGFAQTFPFELPVTGDVTLAVSCTCWSNTAQALGGVVVYLDGNQLGDIPFFFNAASQHMTLPTFFFPVDLGPGPHKISIQPLTANT